jgi:hypothetical protein
MFVIMMDDDTWVNVSNIVKTLLYDHDPAVPMYGGNYHGPGKMKDAFLLGGAGHVLSRGLLTKLRGGQCCHSQVT